MPNITLLNLLAVDAATRGTGQRVIAPLMQYWGPGECKSASASPLLGYVERSCQSSAVSMVLQQPQVGGWGLKSVQQMSRMRDNRYSEAMTSCSAKTGPWHNVQDDVDTGDPKEEIGVEERRAIEKRVEAAVARAIEVERRWTELDKCWDSVIAEILLEWQSELA